MTLRAVRVEQDDVLGCDALRSYRIASCDDCTIDSEQRVVSASDAGARRVAQSSHDDRQRFRA